VTYEICKVSKGAAGRWITNGRRQAKLAIRIEADINLVVIGKSTDAHNISGVRSTQKTYGIASKDTSKGI
jgi:hypothetical protein